MKVAPEILADLCRARAADVLSPLIWRETSFDKTKLLWGLCGVESSFGLRSNPHHDSSYCVGGRHFNPAVTQQWGCLAHCSFGPWQVEFPNLSPGVSPLSLMWADDGRVASDLCLRDAIRVLNVAIARGSQTLADIVLHYNGPANVEHYEARLVECMDRPMPVGAVSVEA